MRDALDILEQLGGWAVLLGDKWTQQNFTWYKVVERANILGFDTNRILSAGAYASEKNKILGVLLLMVTSVLFMNFSDNSKSPIHFSRTKLSHS